MKKFLIVTLAVLFGMGMMAGNTLADNYDPTGAPGHPPIAQLGGTLWNHGGIGDALSGQMYRAVVSNLEDPFAFVTYISIENVSNNFVAAHVRLRSGRYSIEVRDFPILLSPRDIFWFQFEIVPDGSGGIDSVRIFSEDAETLALSGLPSPLWDESLDGRILKQFNKLDYTPEELLAELTQGYIEVFGLFELTKASGNVKSIMNTLWTKSVNVAASEDPADYRAMVDGVAPLDVQKSLAGHVFMGDFQNGLYFGYPMDAIKDFRTDMPVEGSPRPWQRDIDAVKIDGLGNEVALRTGDMQNGDGVWGGANAAGNAGWYTAACILYNYGMDHAYTNPDWATNFGPTWNDGDDWTEGGEWAFDSWSLDEIDDALVKQRIQAPYFNGGFTFDSTDPENTGTYTLAAVTFGTKYLHYFYDDTSGLLNESGVTPLGDSLDGEYGSGRFGWPVGFNPNLAPGVRGNLPVELYMGQVTLRTAAWNLEEKTPADWSPFRTIYFPWELNFIAIGDLSIPRLKPFCFLILEEEDPPYAMLEYDEGYFAGQFLMEGFALYGSSPTGDPRTILWYVDEEGGYERDALPLLGRLQADYDDWYIVPASVLMMDWEFTNFSHARSYKANWDNMVLPSDYPIQEIGAH
jgi:hypothetical protein